ncbi:hypothetical protein ccbrp13_09940 [Ktedonobacteria bacterium brp13]|nr:hypothetical protein ccbrp13_09940 [Ktedonobacteria bacterium brp13]
MSYVLATTNGPTVTLAFVGFEVLALLFWLGTGIVHMKHPEQRQYKGQTPQTMQLQKQIQQWGIVLEGEQATETMQELRQSWDTIQPFLAQYVIILLILLGFLVNTLSLNFSLHGQPAAVNQFWTFASLYS